MAPCGWTVDRCGCGTCWDNYPPAVQDQAAALAALVMWAATGRRYGPCETTVLPCNPTRRTEPLYQTFAIEYDVVRETSQSCGGGCTCAAACEVALDGTVSEILEVTVDGEVISPTAYQVHNGHLLVRVDGQCWPVCQTFGAEIPGFTVTYLGAAIPDAVQYGFELLACEYAKACAGAPCALPPRLSRLSRQGVEVTVAEVSTERGRVRTGIKTVDDIIDADNPYGHTQAPRVLSPDLPAPSRVITWTGGS